MCKNFIPLTHTIISKKSFNPRFLRTDEPSPVYPSSKSVVSYINLRSFFVTAQRRTGRFVRYTIAFRHTHLTSLPYSARKLPKFHHSHNYFLYQLQNLIQINYFVSSLATPKRVCQNGRTITHAGTHPLSCWQRISQRREAGSRWNCSSIVNCACRGALCSRELCQPSAAPRAGCCSLRRRSRRCRSR